MWLAIPGLIEIQISAEECLTPFETLGILHTIVFRMLMQDIMPFMLVFSLFLLNYGTALYLTAPRWAFPEEQINGDGTWNFLSACQSLTSLAIYGDPLHFDVRAILSNGVSPASRLHLTCISAVSRQVRAILSNGVYSESFGPMGEALQSEVALPHAWDYVDFGVFSLLYAFYTLLSIILLLNLLIAMMGDTYEAAKERATIVFRVSLGRRILFYEELIDSFIQAGTRSRATPTQCTAPSAFGVHSSPAHSVHSVHRSHHCTVPAAPTGMCSIDLHSGTKGVDANGQAVYAVEFKSVEKNKEGFGNL